MGDILTAALKALSGQPQPPPNPSPPAPPNLGGDPNTGAPQPNPTPGPNLNTPNLSAGAFGPAAQPTAPPAGPTKAHKLLQILQGGLQGAMAGRAASENAVAQSGGRRSVGAGAGFTAGFELPWQHAMQGQQLEQAKAQTALTQSQSEMVDTPLGKFPAGLAKVIFPASIGAQARTGAAQIGANARTEAADTAAGARVQGAQIGATSRENVADTAAGSREKVANINQGSALPLDETVANLVGLPEMAGQPVGKGTLTNINKMLQARGYQQKDLGTDGMWLTDRAGNKLKRMGDSPSLARAQARPVQAAADPNNPGALTYMSGGEAIRTGAAAPGSAATQAAKGVAKSATSGKIGEEVGAFNTALQHADLLKAAATALNNGDNRTLNSLKNRFKTEFGSADVTNFQAISNAYSREITKMLSSGHMTDSEIGSSEATLPKDASPAQILGAIDAYKALASSKMNVRKQQVEQGMKGKANFPTNYTPPSGAPSATGPNGHRIVVDKGKWVDAQTGAPI